MPEQDNDRHVEEPIDGAGDAGELFRDLSHRVDQLGDLGYPAIMSVSFPLFSTNC